MFYKGQIYGNRKIISTTCTLEDFKDLNYVPKTNLNKYVLTECLNCGQISPVVSKNLLSNPKRCRFCSGVTGTTNIKPNTNNWVIVDDTAILTIESSLGNYTVYIDKEDYERIKKYTWRIKKTRNNYYAMTGSKSKGNVQKMQWLLLPKPTNGFVIDHIDGNGLNNRKDNLQIISISENARLIRCQIDNQIGIRGVCYNKKSKTYQVNGIYNKQRYYFKQFKTIEEAVYCRYVFEDLFNLRNIKQNPLFKEYDTLSKDKKEELKTYVISIINKAKASV